MVTKLREFISAVLLIGSVTACTQDGIYELGILAESMPDGGWKSLTISASQSIDTRAVYDDVNSCALWTIGETIGVVAACDGQYTDTDLQPFDGDNTVASTRANFSGSLRDGGAGAYQLFAVSPYAPDLRSSGPSLFLPNIQYPDADSWDPTCDFMLGVSAVQPDLTDVSKAKGTLTFSHKVGWLCLSFSGFGASQNEKVSYVRISCSDGDYMAGAFSANLTDQTITVSNGQDEFIMADYSGKNITLGQLTAYLTMLPGSYPTLEIAVKTSNHYIECTRTGLSISSGDMVIAPVTYKAGDSNETSQASLCGEMPSMASRTDGQLNVLLLGHSFGLDSSEYVPSLLQAAGVTNVNLCRFYYPDCSLEQYWDFISVEGAPSFFYYWSPGNNAWSQFNSLKVADKLSDTAWDVIILQQSTPGLAVPFGGSADYSSYQPYLSLLMEYIVSTQKSRQNGNAPCIVWNMIHSYRDKYTNMYDAMVTAVGQMQDESGISIVLTPATAMRVARSVYSDDKYMDLCRDNWHASMGIGRYVEACTWFEQLFAPIYGDGLTVAGNSFRPEEYTSFEGSTDDKVDATMAANLQDIAVWTAAHPFPDNTPYPTFTTLVDPSGQE